MGRNSQFPLSLSHKLPLFFPIIALTLFKCNSEISIKNLLYLSFVYYTLEIVKYVGRSNATNQISHWSTADNWKFYKIELQIVLSFDSYTKEDLIGLLAPKPQDGEQSSSVRYLALLSITSAYHF